MRTKDFEERHLNFDVLANSTNTTAHFFKSLKLSNIRTHTQRHDDYRMREIDITNADNIKNT